MEVEEVEEGGLLVGEDLVHLHSGEDELVAPDENGVGEVLVEHCEPGEEGGLPLELLVQVASHHAATDHQVAHEQKYEAVEGVVPLFVEFLELLQHLEA